MNGQDALDTFDLHDDGFVHHEVEAVRTVKLLALVLERKHSLAFESKPAQCQLVRKAFLVRGFEEARSEVSVHLDARPNNGP